MPSQREKDIEYWEKWRRNPSPQTLDPLLKQVDPLLKSEVNRWKGVLSPTTLEAQAKKYAVEAFNTFDHKKNVPLSVHVMNQVKRISRTHYTHQNTARIPEHRNMRIASFNRAENELVDELGRIPSTAEMADHLGWRQQEISRMRRDMRKELIGSEAITPNAIDNQDQSQRNLSYIYHSLNPDEQSLFEATTGYNNQAKMNNKDIQNQFGWTANQLSYRKKKLYKKVDSLRGQLP